MFSIGQSANHPSRRRRMQVLSLHVSMRAYIYGGPPAAGRPPVHSARWPSAHLWLSTTHSLCNDIIVYCHGAPFHLKLLKQMLQTLPRGLRINVRLNVRRIHGQYSPNSTISSRSPAMGVGSLDQCEQKVHWHGLAYINVNVNVNVKVNVSLLPAFSLVCQLASPSSRRGPPCTPATCLS